MDMKIKKIEKKESRMPLWKKAVVATALVAGLGLSLVGCSSAEPVETGKVPQSETTRICYVVESGDTLSGISNATGVYISDIEGIKQGRDIWPGDILYMDVPVESVEKILAGQKNDGLYGTFYLEEDTQEKVYWYVVGKNDYLEKIAKAFGVSVESILAGDWNIEDSNKIYPGQIIMIKSKKEISEIKGLKGVVFATSEEAKNYVLGQGTKPTEPVDQPTTSAELPDGYERMIDISNTCGEINWDKLGAAYEKGEFSGIILRLAENTISSATNDYSFALDKQFEKNLQECNKRGIPYGVYIFTRGYTLERIEAQASDSVKYLKSLEERGIKFRPSYPVYGDFWEESAGNQLKLLTSGQYDTCVDLMVAFNRIIEDAGYFAGCYCNKSSFDSLENASNFEELLEYSFWIACGKKYNNKVPVASVGIDYLGVNFDNNISISQVTKYGKIDGVPEEADVNIANKKLKELVTNFYKSKYGADYYNVNNGPSLRGGVTQIGFAPSRQERRHPGTTYEGVTSSLVSACMNKSQRGAVAVKSIDSAFRGSNIKYTNGKPSFVRFRGMSNKAIGTRTF